ncbi:ATP-binding protein [Streptomyces pinistramenti]|uniref:ATP-binding protein n=1 Tax=Streptomyces pinistramenti TaxID=2884812 RepID=UPI001D0722CA|nr:ATP-binding protein [Streptomyces pinistramenti]MCB5912122.1 ATP-binding protein [Streptomyces pinistramenti]
MTAEAGAPEGPTPPVPDEPRVEVHGDNTGVISIGSHNVIYQNFGFVKIPSVQDLPLPAPPVLPAPARADLFGRAELVAQVVGQLAEGTSVQLYGERGVGKEAVADAVHRELAAGGRRGHVLRPRTGEDGTLDVLYDRLAKVFSGQNFLREVDETMLHAAVADVTDVHITVIDSTLNRQDLARLLQTFPGCTFLFTSPYPTLPGSAAAHHVQPLSPAAATELLSAELGLPLGPAGLQNLQFDHAYRMSGGKPQRLCQYAAFIKGSDEWRAREAREPYDQPPPVDPAQLSPLHQAEALTVALSEPARRVLVALATFGTPLPAAWFAPVTGEPQDADAGPELHDRRLVTYHGDTYHLTEDAAAAVRHQNWAAADAATAAQGLMAAFDAPDAPPSPDAHLLLAVARALRDTRQWAPASRFVRAAVPIALAEGRGQLALQLYVLGKAAATRSGMKDDLKHYVRNEKLTRNLLEGDKAAAAAALLVLTPAVGHAAAHGGKVAGYLGKLTATLSTKAGVTVAAVSVAAVTATGVVVATSGPPAGCDEAHQVSEVGPDRLKAVRTSPDLVALYRHDATDLGAAAAKATDTEVKSTLQQQADEAASLADKQQRDGDGLGPDVHPDVRAALMMGKATTHNIQVVSAVMKVCPTDN